MHDALVPESSHAGEFLVGGGIMGELIRTKDWAGTPLGAIDHWPQSLRTTVSLCLSSNFPINVVWGPQHVQIYNDGYRPICAGKHPKCLGEDFTVTWVSAWEILAEAFQRALDGVTSYLENQRMFLDRNGYLEETFFTFSLSPIRDESGQVGGLFHPVTETTAQMLSQRRTRALQDLAVGAGQGRTVEQACILSAESLSRSELDLPFVLIYLLDESGRRARLVANAHLAPGTEASPAIVEFGEAVAQWPLAEAAETGAAVTVSGLRNRASVQCGPYPEGPDTALVLPISLAGMNVATAILVVGVSARLPFTDEYRAFLDLTAAVITAGIANARTYEEARQRAEKLAQLDRAKTEFFSNVSHEFRTPLTLMLGPLEAMLAQPQDELAVARESLDLVHRNSLRLLRLVNSLLDFSRIEANRASARFEPVDLSEFTRDLASLFRSATDKAGLTLEVDCPSLSDEVYVDREMWEKILLNLLSNAFKFTFEGKITVALAERDDHVELLVADTGTGIPTEELAHLFKRFHRVQGARGRSYEGSGIGLALVDELVKLHGGRVWAESEPGSGTTIHVTIPRGFAHLPSDRVETARHPVAGDPTSSVFVEEALRWLPSAAANRGAASSQQRDKTKPRIVLADDNSDMRHYIEGILGQEFDIQSVCDGNEALAAIDEDLPDLVLTDVMMPGLDGLGLLSRLRSAKRTQAVPIIMLSARAGEESRVDGIQAGADDYLVKPFNARELLARVRVNLELARLRRDLAREEESRLGTEALRQSDARRTLALESARLGDWEVDFTTNLASRSLRHAEIFGYTDASGDWSFETFLKHVHPDDRQQARSTLEDSLRRGERLETELRIVRPSGEMRWILAHGDIYLDSAGKPARLFGSVQDITERKQIAETLRESEEKMRLLLDGVKDYAVYMLDPEGRVATWNEGATRIKGYGAQEILGRSVAMFYTPDDQAKGFPDVALREAIGQGRFEKQVEFVRKDGSTFWAHAVILPIYDQAGNLRGFSKVSRDISEQKRTQEALLASDQRFQTLANSIPQLVWMAEPDGHIFWYNQRWYDYTGTTFEEMQGWGWQSVHDPAVLPDVMMKWKHSIDTREPFEMVFPLRAANGTFNTFLTRVTPQRDQDGKITRLFGTNTDITGQRMIENALREHQERLELAHEVAKIGTFEWNLESGGGERSPTLEAMYGLPAGGFEAANKTWLDLIHPDDREATRQRMQDALVSGSFEAEWRVLWPNGEEHSMLGRARVMRDLRGRPLRLIGAVLDITDRKRSEMEILRINSELEERVQHRTIELESANKEIAAFAYSVSHDLRAPLRGIDGWSSALLEDYGSQLDAGAHEYLNRVRSETQRMGTLIDDMLRLSRLTREEMNLMPVDLTALANGIAGKLSEAQPQRSMKFMIAPELVAAGDRRLLEIALTNLLSNAVKFTGKRDVALIEFGRIEKEGENAFFVKDNGVGFNMAYLNTLFGAFQRLHKDSEFPGTGVGLAIVQRVIGRHGGRVWAEAELNQGATFWFTLN